MNGQRRQFIQHLGLSAAALSLPGWMQACARTRQKEAALTAAPSGIPAVADPAGAKPPHSALEAFESARARGRPLLLIVVPDDAQTRSDRGESWGVYLNYVDAAGLADLALCDVWCARPAELRAAFPMSTTVDDSTVAVLVEPEGRTSQIVGGPLPMLWNSFGYVTRKDETMDDLLRAHNDWLSARLRAVIAPSVSVLEQRAAANRASRTAAEWRASGLSFEEDAPASAALANHAPAFVRWRAERGDATERARCLHVLAEQASARLRAKPPPPARWARAEACGAHIEGEKNSGSSVPCGTAFTPVYSSRFLVFYVDDDG